MMKLIQDGSLVSNSVASMFRIVPGFLLGSLLGVVLGLGIGVSRLVRHILIPYVEFLRFVSALAWISAFMIWFGIGEASKILLLVYATTFAVCINVIAGVSSLPGQRIRAAESLGASKYQAFAWVTVPSSVPYIISGMRIGMQNSFMTIVAAEMIASNSGLGFLIMSSRNFMLSDRILVAIVALGILGLATDQFVRSSARFLLARYQVGD